MVIYKAKDYQDMSRKAANIISAQIIMKPNCVLGLATGSSPVGTYKQLIEWYKKGDLDFSQVTSVNLDEYKGLSPENDQSYRYFMNTNLFDHVNIDKTRTFVPNGLEADSDKACSEYNEIIRKQGGNRQHRAGFLDIKQTTQMFCGTAQWQRRFVIPFNPKTLCTPWYWRQLPVIRRDQRQKIGDTYFQRVDANTPAQRPLTGGDKIV